MCKVNVLLLLLAFDHYKIIRWQLHNIIKSQSHTHTYTHTHSKKDAVIAIVSRKELRRTSVYVFTSAYVCVCSVYCVYYTSRRNEFHDPNARFLNPFCEHCMKKKILSSEEYALSACTINTLNKISERWLLRLRTRCLSTIMFDFVADFASCPSFYYC